MTDGLLLVHAFPLDARMWEPQLTTFADALPVVDRQTTLFEALGPDPTGRGHRR